MATKKTDAPRKTVYRNSEDGQFVKRSYAEANPRTTEKERVRIHPPRKK